MRTRATMLVVALSALTLVGTSARPATSGEIEEAPLTDEREDAFVGPPEPERAHDAEDVGSVAERRREGPGEKVEDSLDRAGEATSRSIERGAEPVGRGLERAMKATGRGIRKAIEKTGEGLNRAGDALTGGSK